MISTRKHLGPLRVFFAAALFGSGMATQGATLTYHYEATFSVSAGVGVSPGSPKFSFDFDFDKDSPGLNPNTYYLVTPTNLQWDPGTSNLGLNLGTFSFNSGWPGFRPSDNAMIISASASATTKPYVDAMSVFTDQTGYVTYVDTADNFNLLGNFVGYQTTIVPEPSTYALLLLSGAASLWALKRRKS